MKAANGEGPAAPGGQPSGEHRPSRHGPLAQLLIAWAPLSLILLTYAAADWVTAPLEAGHRANRLGFELHLTGPPAVDRTVFGAVPSVWLQDRLADGSAHWYDALAALVYVTHFVSIPVLTGVVWFVLRDRFPEWIAAVLTFTAVGVSGYIVYPASPPWLASTQDVIGGVDRISNLGWDYLHLHVIGELLSSGQESSNPVAAMPSLHAGAAMLVALFLWRSVRPATRTLLAGYVLLMAAALVYTGEHYVVDVVAGWLTAAVAVAVGATVRRRPGPGGRVIRPSSRAGRREEASRGHRADRR